MVTTSNPLPNNPVKPDENTHYLIDSVSKAQQDSQHTKQPFDYFPFGGSFGVSEYE
jgi:hypothetical protein